MLVHEHELPDLIAALSLIEIIVLRRKMLLLFFKVLRKEMLVHACKIQSSHSCRVKLVHFLLHSGLFDGSEGFF